MTLEYCASCATSQLSARLSDSGGVEITPFEVLYEGEASKLNHQSRTEYVLASSGRTQRRRQ